MDLMPTQISNLIERQFPEFYREDGRNFVTFVKAYYEWLEQNFQLLTFEDPTGFAVGDVISQKDVTGTITADVNGDFLVLVDGKEAFTCMSLCSDLTPVTNGTQSTMISRGGSPRRLGTIFQARSLRDYTDIDRTIDMFIVQFKEKYLKNIQFNTATNQELLVKNSLDLYRSKGSERSVDLFFRLVYGLKAEVRRPSDFLFKPSEAEWAVPRYIEISSLNPQRAIAMVGKEITGVTSRATAFVEKYVKIKTPAGFSHILFVSNIKGNFILRELLKDDDVFPDSPIIYGSMNRLEVINPVGEFNIGDIVDLESATGFGGKGRVVEVRFASGQVDFELIFGGYGYTVNAGVNADAETQIEIADYLVSISNVDVGNTISSVSISSPGSGYANTDTFTLTSNYGYDATGFITTDGSGAITDVTLLNRGSGFIYPTPNDIPVVITTSGGTGADLLPTEKFPNRHLQLLEPIRQDGLVTSPTGYAINIPTRGSIEISEVTGTFAEGEIVVQVDPDLGVVSTGVIASVSSNLNVSTAILTNVTGCFRKDYPISSSGTGQGTLTEIQSLTFSMKQDSVDDFVLDETSEIIGTNTGLKGNPSLLSGGSNASFSVTSIESTEEVRVSSDILGINFAIPLNTPGLFDVTLPAFANYETVTIGKVRTIGSINPGEQYTSDPELLIYQPFIAPYRKKDLILNTSDGDGTFSINEEVTQTLDVQLKEFTVSDTSILSVDESVFITDGGGNTITTGIVFDITSPTVVEVIDTGTSDYTGSTLRSTENGTTSLTILGDSLVDRQRIARGIVKGVSDGILNIERLTFADHYLNGVRVVGVSSGASANVDSFTEEESDNFIGLNAVVESETVTSNGAVGTLEVVDSGFGFIDQQEANFEFAPGLNGSVKVLNGGVGTGSGSHRSIKGFPSDQSKLFDGNYWQEYSYDIMSRVPIDKYADMFRRVMHTAGTQFFGSILIDTELDISNKGGFTNSDRELISDSEVIIGNTSPYTIESSSLQASPAPWNVDPNTVSQDLRDDLSPTVDRADINIEVRN